MLKKIDKNLWTAEQPLKFWGLEVGTRMTVVKLSDNSLVLISPIAIDYKLQQQLNDLGLVEYIAAPNLFHYLYIDRTKKLYPYASIVAPPGLAQKQPNLEIDRTFTKDVVEFNGELEHYLLAGFRAFVPPKIAVVNEIIFYHPVSKTLIITDSAFNFDRTFPLITQLAARALGSYGVLKPSWIEKIVVKDKKQLKQSIERVLQWDFERVILAHGQIVDSDAKQPLAEGYHWLLQP